MFDKEKFAEILAYYKRDFDAIVWNNERYKWVAVKHFQDAWDVNADDFPAMLEDALSSCGNLLTTVNRFPLGMIVGAAKNDPERVRAMFLDLYDEDKDYYERIAQFKASATKHHEDMNGADTKLNHYQDENAITTYLWLRYPDRYYIYKYGEVRKVAAELNSDWTIKKGAYAANVRNHLALYDELCAELKMDSELVRMLADHLDDDCYSDSEMRTLTADFGFYISRYYHDLHDSNVDSNGDEKDAYEWIPSKEEYDPGITVERWVELIGDKEVFTDGALQIVKRLKDIGGQATCTQLAEKYGEKKNFYNSGSVALARRVANRTGCPIDIKEKGGEVWWSILYLGRYADKDEVGSFVWRLRDELAEALEIVDLDDVPLYVSGAAEEVAPNYWWLVAKPAIWSFDDLAIGEVQTYTLYNDNGNKRRVFQNFLDARAGDVVIGYESYPVQQIRAIAMVAAPQDGETILFEKVEGLANPIDYKDLKAIPELEGMEYFVNPTGSLFKLTAEEYNCILDAIRDENPVASQTDYQRYTKDDFLAEVYMTPERYDHLVAVLLNKKNVILQGAPGVGKTFAARRLAWSIMGEKDESRVEFVQFHQSYSYEDFVMGYKPDGEGFELKYGVFYRFCQKAANQPDKEHFFIIDEINRGNMSKIFGELLMLIENDYRGEKATLAYSGMPFSVPENLYIIGMMNTADRSLAMIDYALRRRFSFFEMGPGFDTAGFSAYRESLADDTLDELVTKVCELNEEIARDRTLGKGFCIGHSYFCGREECTDEWIHEIVEYDILPMLSEYWFDDTAKLTRWENILRGVLA